MKEFIPNKDYERGLSFNHKEDDSKNIYLELTKLYGQDAAIRRQILENLRSHSILKLYVLQDNEGNYYTCGGRLRTFTRKSGASFVCNRLKRDGNNYTIKEVNLYSF